MFTLAVVYTQSLLHENGIVQLLHNYKCYSVVISHFRKPLQSCAKKVKNNYLHFHWLFNVYLVQIANHFDKMF